VANGVEVPQVSTTAPQSLRAIPLGVEHAARFPIAIAHSHLQMEFIQNYNQ